MVSLIGLLVLSCNKDECTQDCYLQEVYNPALKTSIAKTSGTYQICHYDATTNSYFTLILDENGLQGHQNHTNDNLTGPCGTLGIEDYNVFGPITAWQIPCGYSEETIFIDSKEYYITY